MKSLKNLLTITNADGSVKTFFDGRITATQLIVIAVLFIVSVILIKKLKRMGKLIVLVCFIASTYFNVQLFSPAKVVDTISIIASQPVVKKRVSEMASKSDNIQLIGDELQVKVNDTWINVSDVTSMVKTYDGKLSITVDGKDILVNDKAIIEILKLFTN